MPFGLEEMHKQYDVVITASTANSIVILPLIELSSEITNEILAINSLPGWRVGLETGKYFIFPPTPSDPLAFAERIAMELEKKGMRVQRISQALANAFKPVNCQSFILA